MNQLVPVLRGIPFSGICPLSLRLACRPQPCCLFQQLRHLLGCFGLRFQRLLALLCSTLLCCLHPACLLRACLLQAFRLLRQCGCLCGDLPILLELLCMLRLPPVKLGLPAHLRVARLPCTCLLAILHLRVACPQLVHGFDDRRFFPLRHGAGCLDLLDRLGVLKAAAFDLRLHCRKALGRLLQVLYATLHLLFVCTPPALHLCVQVRRLLSSTLCSCLRGLLLLQQLLTCLPQV
mmetsp:Transcript_30607/g.69699  ORF Transcript_30607/g.69699 Transcript_30607/m.69699 type:complete len:235 (+) Transcript_30607:746-1450(+)